MLKLWALVGSTFFAALHPLLSPSFFHSAIGFSIFSTYLIFEIYYASSTSYLFQISLETSTLFVTKARDLTSMPIHSFRSTGFFMSGESYSLTYPCNREAAQQFEQKMREQLNLSILHISGENKMLNWVTARYPQHSLHIRELQSCDYYFFSISFSVEDLVDRQNEDITSPSKYIIVDFHRDKV